MRFIEVTLFGPDSLPTPVLKLNVAHIVYMSQTPGAVYSDIILTGGIELQVIESAKAIAEAINKNA